MPAVDDRLAVPGPALRHATRPHLRGQEAKTCKAGDDHHSIANRARAPPAGRAHPARFARGREHVTPDTPATDPYQM
eukprot:scaffold2504_cov405-Prasinococcus_capsulatus_cf.AAC.5